MKIITNKWLWLVVFVLCWTAGGFAVFSRSDAEAVAVVGDITPQRIVSMAPTLTEILFALGLGEHVVGVTAYSNYPPAAKEKPVMGTFWQPNIEAVIAARPDLILTLGFDQQTTLAGRLRRLNYSTLTVDIEKVDQLFEAIAEIGAVTKRVSQADGMTRRLRANLDNISELVSTGDKPKVLWIIQIEPLRVAGTETFINELIELAGGVNAIGPTINKYPPIGPEQIIATSPDVIIESAMFETDLIRRRKELIKHFGRFANIDAVQTGRIYVIDGDTVARLGPRIDQAVENIAKCLRPELFEN